MSKLNCHLASNLISLEVCIDGNQDTGCSFQLDGGVFERTVSQSQTLIGYVGMDVNVPARTTGIV